VGVAIGLIVVACALRVLIQTRNTTDLLQDRVELHQRAEIIFYNMAHQISHASTANGGRETSGLNNLPPRLSLHYDAPPDGDAFNCLGWRPHATLTNPHPTINSEYFLSSNARLMCTDAAAHNTQTIASGVRALDVEFLIETPHPDGSGWRYVKAPELGPAAGAVRAVAVCLHLFSERRYRTEANPVQRDCQNTAPLPDDGYLHQVFRRTFAMRNSKP